MSASEAAQAAAAVRAGAGLFRLDGPAAGDQARALVEVSGGDRVRWLNGMVSNDVAALAPGPSGSTCYATLLTPKGMIVADLQILLRPEGFWLDLQADAVADVLARLDRYIVADDVRLGDVTERRAHWALEGPTAAAVLSEALGPDAGLPAADGIVDVSLAGAEVAVAGYGWTGERAFQLLVPGAQSDAVAAAVRSAGAGRGLVEPGPEALEILRIEAGIPRLGAELGDDVLPDEARLARAISTTKGCYTGQEIVARIRSRGRVNHLLVGLRFALPEGRELPPPGAELRAGDRRTGELTSACRSSAAGPIGLGYVRRDDARPGTVLDCAGLPVEVAELPFLGPPAADSSPAALGEPVG